MKHPSLDEIVALHYRIVQKTNGLQGVRDIDLLASALGRPQTTFGGKDLYPNIFLKTAAMIQSILLNHPFVDANKRTALATAEYFLYLNRKEIKATQHEKVEFTLWVENKKPTIEQIASWIEKRLK